MTPTIQLSGLRMPIKLLTGHDSICSSRRSAWWREDDMADFPAGPERVKSGKGSERKEYTSISLFNRIYGRNHELQAAGIPVGELLLKEKVREERSQNSFGVKSR
jgi:hypothetical protein